MKKRMKRLDNKTVERLVDAQEIIEKKKRYTPVKIASDRIIARAGSISRVPQDEETQNAMINAMYEWVKSAEDIFELEEWAHMHNINPYRFYRCANNNEYFADVLEAIHSYVAKRYKRGIRKREIDQAYGLKMLYEHDPNYRDSCMAKIKADKESRAAAIVAVQMQQYESSGLVPDKKETIIHNNIQTTISKDE